MEVSGDGEDSIVLSALQMGRQPQGIFALSQLQRRDGRATMGFVPSTPAPRLGADLGCPK